MNDSKPDLHALAELDPPERLTWGKVAARQPGGSHPPRHNRAATVVTAFAVLALVGLLLVRVFPINPPGRGVSPGVRTSLPVPPVGEARPAMLSNGRPVFVVHHEDGSVNVVDGISTHVPWGIGHPVSWCPTARVFQDEAHGSMFNEYGSYIFGPAPTGLVRYASDLGDVEEALPPLPRRPDESPSTQGPFCEGAGSVEVTVPEPTTLATAAEDTPGTWASFLGRLVVPRNGEIMMCSEGAQVPCADGVPVSGIDRGIVLQGRVHDPYLMDGRWIAAVTAGGFLQPVLVVPAPFTEADRQAGFDLLNARAAARAWSIEHNDKLTGFDATAAERIEPAINWANGDSKPGAVSIREASGSVLLLTTQSETGSYLCLGQDQIVHSSTQRFGIGKDDFLNLESCTSGWPEGFPS